MKMNKKTLLITSLTAAVITLSSRTAYVAFAANLKVSAAKPSLVSQAKISVQQVSDIVEKKNKGCTIDKIELRTKHGVAVYKIDITSSNRKKSEVVVNAKNGTIIQTKAKVHKKNKCERKAAIQLQQQTLDKNWPSMTAAQKEQVYVLKDAEFDRQIAKVKSHVAAGYKTQAEADKIVAQIQKRKSEIRASGNAPKFRCIVKLPTTSK